MKKFSVNITLFSSIFISFLDFLTLPCYKETNDLSLKQMMSAFFHFQHNLNRLFNNCVELLILDKFFLKYEGQGGVEIGWG